MPRRPRNPWIGLSMDAWTMGLEASAVIGLRTLKMAAGGAEAQAEAQRMVSEKTAAAMELAVRAMTGGLGASPAAAAAGAVSHYRRKVRANRRRLSKS